MLRFLFLLLCCLIYGCSSAPEKTAHEKNACLSPDPPAIPSGQRAKEEQIIAITDTVKKYLSQNAVYQACLEEKAQEAAALQNATGDKLLNAIHILLSESREMDTFVTEMLNREIKIYRSLQE